MHALLRMIFRRLTTADQIWFYLPLANLKKILKNTLSIFSKWTAIGLNQVFILGFVRHFSCRFLHETNMRESSSQGSDSGVFYSFWLNRTYASFGNDLAESDLSKRLTGIDRRKLTLFTHTEVKLYTKLLFHPQIAFTESLSTVAARSLRHWCTSSCDY